MTVSASEMIVRLQLAGEHKKAEKLAALVTERLEEDLRFDDPAVRNNGKCGGCNRVFTEEDCQHEIKNYIACDDCYLEYIRPITLADLED